MADIVLLVLSFFISMLLTYLAFRSEFRMLVTFLAGLAWLAIALMIFQSGLDANNMFSIICIGIGMYIWARIIIR